MIRPRQDEDLPRLVELLGEQQAASGYPFRWPLPFPVEEFLVRPTEEAAWVAELDGQVLGHVSVGSVADHLRERFVAATGSEELGMVQVLFVAAGLHGRGVGGRLLDVAVASLRERSLLPVLDVLVGHSAAVAVYRSRGWRTVGRFRPEWLPGTEEPLLLMSLPD